MKTPKTGWLQNWLPLLDRMGKRKEKNHFVGWLNGKAMFVSTLTIQRSY